MSSTLYSLFLYFLSLYWTLYFSFQFTALVLTLVYARDSEPLHEKKKKKTASPYFLPLFPPTYAFVCASAKDTFVRACRLIVTYAVTSRDSGRNVPRGESAGVAIFSAPPILISSESNLFIFFILSERFLSEFDCARRWGLNFAGVLLIWMLRLIWRRLRSFEHVRYWEGKLRY